MGAIQNLGGWYDLAVNQFGSGQARQALGQTVANIGSMVTPNVVGAGPVTGLANTIAGKPVTGTYDTPYIQPKPSGMVTGGNNNTGTGQVNGVTTRANTTPTGPSDSELQQLSKMDRNPSQESRYRELMAQQGQGQPDIQSQIDALYNPSFQYLTEAENTLNAQYPDVQKSIQGQFDVNTQMLNDQNTSGLSTLDRNATSAGYRKEDALTAARRLYDELRRGYQQRFGGSTSAGEAASELSSVEQQRQMGLTQRSYSDTMAQIDTQKYDLDRGYSTAKTKLKYDTDSAFSQAKSDFQNKLLSISQSRSQIASAKAQASLSALQTLRNEVFQINSQKIQFEQTLELQRSQAATALDTYARQMQMSGQGSQSALNNYFNQTTTTPASPLSINSSNGQNTPNYTGQISGKVFKGYDQNGQPIYG